MRLFVDANILLDVFQNKEPYVQDSVKVWKLCETVDRQYRRQSVKSQ